MQLNLPEPSADALATSRQLQNFIANEIRRQSGWISFARYMELALYAPDLGYYSGGATKLGKDGDFTTAPEITPLFGKTLARCTADFLTQTAPNILEFGAGSGKLAYDILTELTAIGAKIERYSIVELSGELRARQQHLLRDFPQVEWLDHLPKAFSGVMIGNEVLDAMPVHLVVKTEQGWKERGVGLSNKKFVYRDRSCEPTLTSQIPYADTLPVGYITEVHPSSTAFMHSIAHMLKTGEQGGVAIFLDYGFPAREYYLPQRSMGTLMCHYRHHSHSDPFYYPGLQDITAHVDFSAMAHTACQEGLYLLGYMSQASFLTEAGIADILLRTSPEDQAHYLPQANAVQKLTSPAEMGELFKVLVVGKNASLPEKFGRNDRSHRL